ncbi:MAG: serine--tRNA ligase [Rickettsiales bacterium]|nr:serine--tRNA ligase [Rickettsiales bacterium]
MHNIKFIRENPEIFDKEMARRGLEPLSQKILEVDKARRNSTADLQKLQEESNRIAKQIGDLMAQGKKSEAGELIEKSKELKSQLQELKKSQEQNQDEESEELKNLLATIPNILASDVPEGKDESENKEIRRFGEVKNIQNPKHHFEIAENLGLLDFENTALISGARFATSFGVLAKLERALASFMIDIATQDFGYLEASPPYLVKPNAMFGTGQLPKFEADLFKTSDDFYLIPTAEVPITNLVREKILEEKSLPLRYTAFTPCFRSEAGSAGKDTRGLIRMHQFSKVELVSITKAEDSATEHERLISCAEKILQLLKLPYRVIVLCAGDTGFGSSKTYDIEVWLPAQNKYREISSCSNFRDFQARRMNARYRKSDNKIEFLHTLNGSSLAIGRTIAAILENYQNADGSVTIPEILSPYMGGLTKISS